MARGATCLWCGADTAHDFGSHRECSKCGSISWDLNDVDYEIGQGKGKKCNHCQNETLHKIANVPNENKKYIYRCSVCNAVLITGTID